jgi:hypothetical protein
MQNDKPATKVITGLVRFSYAHVFKPHSSIDGAEPKYSVCLLVPKKDRYAVAALKAGIEAAMDSGKTLWGGKIPKNAKYPLRDGDEERPDDENYLGMFFLNASSKMKPKIIDRDKNEILDSSDFYSGCWGRAAINFFPFSQAGNKGVGVGLNNLQKLKDGDPLSSRSRAEDDFAEDLDLGDDDDPLG